MNPVIERSTMRGGVATFRHRPFLETSWKPQTSIYFQIVQMFLSSLHTGFPEILPFWPEIQGLGDIVSSCPNQNNTNSYMEKV